MTSNNDNQKLISNMADKTDKTQEELAERVESTVSEYSIQTHEAIRTVAQELDIDPTTSTANSTTLTSFNPTPIEEIDTEGSWHDIHGKVVYLFDPNHKNIAQTGLLKGEEETIKYVIWENDEEPVETLEKGESYHISKVVCDEYEGKYSVEFRPETEVSKADEDPTLTITEGLIVDYNQKSGLIKRCPEDDCSRVLNGGVCSTHSRVEGEYDLRIKAIIDDGEEAQTAIFNQEATENALDISLEEAKQLCLDNLNENAVDEIIEEELIGTYATVGGQLFEDRLIVEEFEVMGDLTEKEINAVQNRVGATTGSTDQPEQPAQTST